MQLLTYKDPTNRFRAGVKLGARVFDAEALSGRPDCETVFSLLQNWDVVEPVLTEQVNRLAQDDLVPVKMASLGPPVLYPGAIYCAAANFRDHMRAMAIKLNQPEEPNPRETDIKPYHFIVPGRSCVSGPDDPLKLPSFGTKVDWELELVAVIGRSARDVPSERALDYVAGYTIGNDVSVRDHRYLKIPNVPAQSLFRTDFLSMKAFDQSCAIGPWLTLARDIPDPQQLAMKLWLDGELMQNSSTAEMIFTVAEQISYLSSRVTLLPGDIVMTGTPAGTGMERDRFLRPGETIRMSIEGIGEMTQKVISWEALA
jgi:2-keto-4-pentenoate hydratase/2-oxohepta-3-ene-1,7-dioic acid hydratase in catechol pathway